VCILCILGWLISSGCNSFCIQLLFSQDSGVAFDCKVSVLTWVSLKALPTAKGLDAITLFRVFVPREQK
jgi:hypothetical protein